jgi:hypothetical protein
MGGRPIRAVTAIDMACCAATLMSRQGRRLAATPLGVLLNTGRIFALRTLAAWAEDFRRL